MRKYPKIRYPSHESVDGIFSRGEIVVLEKIDGANFRFTYHEDTDSLLFGTRNVVFSEDGEPLPKEECNSQFHHVIEYLQDRVDTDVFRDINPTDGEQLVWYGESMHKHSIDYDAWGGQEPDIDGPIPNYIGFDIWDPNKGEFVPHDMVKQLHELLGLCTVPIVEWVNADDFSADDAEIPESHFREPDPDAENEFDRRGLAEGVVVKNVDLDIRTKVLHDEFKEKNAVTFNDTSKAQTEAGRFVAKYVTDARVEKMIHKTVDETEYGYEMTMMEALPRRVLEDIMVEEGWEIMTDDIELDEDIKYQIRKKTSSKCARILKQTLQTQGLEGAS